MVLALSNPESVIALTIRRRDDVLARVLIVVEFARTSLLRRWRTCVLIRCLLPIFVFMAYGCACAEVGHVNSEHHLDSFANISPVHAIAAFGYADYANRAEKCHDDLPTGSTPDVQAGAGLWSQHGPSGSHILPMTGWVSSLASGQERAPPGGLSRATHPEVGRTGATALAMLCVFRS